MAAGAIRKGYVDTSHGQVHYRTAGDGEPVILLHMSPSSSAMWEPVIPLLAQRGYRVIALDTPGYGDSYHPDRPLSLPEYGEVILEAIDRLGIDTFLIFGHHTGGMIGAALAAAHPERVKKFATWGWTLMDDERKAGLATMPLVDYDEEGEQVTTRWKSRVASAGDRWTPQLGMRGMIDTLKAGRELPYGFWAVGKADHVAMARAMSMPVLVMCGERDGIFEESRQAVALMPNARFQHFPNGSTAIPDEAPAELVDAVDRFFRA